MPKDKDRRNAFESKRLWILYSGLAFMALYEAATEHWPTLIRKSLHF